MKKNTVKRANYSLLLNRITLAIKEEFYLEAIWIAYAIIEDRLTSALKKCGGEYYLPVKIKPVVIRMLGKKIEEINNRKGTNKVLKLTFYDSLLDNLQLWADDRNKLMHAIAGETRPISNLQPDIIRTAVEGQKLAKSLATRLMRLKKHLKQIL